jgi:hypothetical protein
LQRAREREPDGDKAGGKSHGSPLGLPVRADCAARQF